MAKQTEPKLFINVNLPVAATLHARCKAKAKKQGIPLKEFIFEALRKASR